MAMAVAHGQGLQAAADMMGVALTTARSSAPASICKDRNKTSSRGLAALVHRTLTQIQWGSIP